MIRYIFFFHFFIISFCLQYNSNAQDTSKAQDTLYPPNPSGPTKIYVSLVINNISEVNTAIETIKADIFLTFKWKDPRLAHTGKRRRLKSTEESWDPLLTITNRLNMTKSLPEEPIILSDGTIIYVQRVFGDFMQDFELENFPMDIQTFKITLVAIGASAGEIEIEPDPEFRSGISDYLKLLDWKILDWKYDASPYTFMKGESALPSITFSMRAQRESGFYFLVYVIPLVLIILMSFTVFWLNPELASSQISIATTSMLTLIAYRYIVVGSLPKISYLTRIDIFVLGSSILIFITFLQAILTASLMSKGNKTLTIKIDFYCRWIFPLLYIIVCLFAFTF